MNKAQKQHMDRVARDFVKPMVEKYKKGQQEHGGNLWLKPTFKMMGEEVIDFWVYFHVLNEHLTLVKQKLSEALRKNTKGYGKATFADAWVYHTHAMETILQVYNILEFGNPQGEKLKD